MAFDQTKLNLSSFRGVSFYTSENETSGAQRLTDHKFINGGTKTESNGIDNDLIKLTGYIGGDNYLEQKIALRDAFKNIESGILIDKFYGTIEVFVDKWAIKESIRKIGHADIEVTFKRAENNITETTDIVFTANAKVETIDNFKNDFNNKIGEDLLDQIGNNINNFLNTVNDSIKFVRDDLDKIEAIKAQIGEMKSKIKTAILDVEELASDIEDLYLVFDDILDVSIFSPAEQKGFTNNLRTTIEQSSSNQSDNETQNLINQQTQLYINTTIIGLTQTAINNLVNVEFDTGNDFGSIKDDILFIFETLEESVSYSSSTRIDEIIFKENLLNKYQTAKKEFIQFYTQKYSGLQNLNDNEIVATVDALSLTMQKYNDITRVDEILVNNDIVDPIFINGNLKLLDR